uniref:Uncharacterized protein n=1 Tax=Arundo donax TaxID=35708 RepID=A0A0A9HU64_ARUDO
MPVAKLLFSSRRGKGLLWLVVVLHISLIFLLSSTFKQSESCLFLPFLCLFSDVLRYTLKILRLFSDVLASNRMICPVFFCFLF